MTNEEYVRRLGQLYEKVINLRKDEDYIINQPQMDKFVEILNFFFDLAKTNKASIKTDLVPREERGNITATFIIFDIFGEQIQDFCKVMQHASAMEIDATLDHEVCISITVPEVFVPIEK